MVEARRPPLDLHHQGEPPMVGVIRRRPAGNRRSELTNAQAGHSGRRRRHRIYSRTPVLVILMSLREATATKQSHSKVALPLRGDEIRGRVGGVKRNPPSVASSLFDKWVGLADVGQPNKMQRKQYRGLRPSSVATPVATNPNEIIGE